MLSPQQEGRGLGTAAVELLIRYARDSRRYKYLQLLCAPENAAARHIYDKLGFRPTGAICFGDVEMRLALQTLPFHTPRLARASKPAGRLPAFLCRFAHGGRKRADRFFVFKKLLYLF